MTKKLLYLILAATAGCAANSEAAEPPTPAPITFGFDTGYQVQTQDCPTGLCPTATTFGFARTVQRQRIVTRQPVVRRQAIVQQAAPVMTSQTVNVPVTSWVDEEVEVMEWVQVPVKKTVRKAVTTYEQRAVQVACQSCVTVAAPVCQSCVSQVSTFDPCATMTTAPTVQTKRMGPIRRLFTPMSMVVTH